MVAVDEHAQTVEIQYFEGEIEELDLDTWYNLVLDPIDPPEDWSGPYDDLERGELGDGELPAGHGNQENPLANLD